MNNKYIITVTHPVIRPGLTISTESSERYVVKVASKLLSLCRELNSLTPTGEISSAPFPGETK